MTQRTKKYFGDNVIAVLGINYQPISGALRLILRSQGVPFPDRNARLRLTLKGDTIHIIAIPVAANGLPTIPVTYGPGTLSSALKALLKGTDFSVAVTDDRALTRAISVRDVPANEAIARLMRRFPDLTLSASEDAVAIKSAKTVAEEAKAAAERQQREEAENRRLLTTQVTVDVADANIGQVLEKLFAEVGVANYVIDPNIGGGKVTLRLKEEKKSPSL